MRPFDVDPTRGVYGISVAADLVGMDPQSLRLYERHGLVAPARTDGGTRRYSGDDLLRLERIGALLDAGLNLAGIAMVLRLETDNSRLRARLGQVDEAVPAAGLPTAVAGSPRDAGPRSAARPGRPGRPGRPRRTRPGEEDVPGGTPLVGPGDLPRP